MERIYRRRCLGFAVGAAVVAGIGGPDLVWAASSQPGDRLKLSTAPPAAAVAPLPPRSFAAVLPKAAQSIDDWQSSRRTGLTPGAKKRIQALFYNAAQDTATKAGVSLATIDASAQSPLYDFLDQSMTSPQSAASLESLVNSTFGVRGPSAPEAEVVGVIAVTYVHHVSYMVVGHKRWDPWSKFLSETGVVPIAGHAGAGVVCHGTVTVSAAQEADFTC